MESKSSRCRIPNMNRPMMRLGRFLAVAIPFVRHEMTEFLNRLEAEQEANLAAINAEVTRAEADIRKIGSDLKLEAAAERRTLILEALKKTTDALLDAMDRRAAQVAHV